MVVRTVASAARSGTRAALDVVRYGRSRLRLPEGCIDIHDGRTLNACLLGLPDGLRVDLVGPYGEVTSLGPARVRDGRPTMTVDLLALDLAEGRHHLLARIDEEDGRLLQLGLSTSPDVARDGLVCDAGGAMLARIETGPVTSVVVNRSAVVPRFSRLVKAADDFHAVTHGLGQAVKVVARERTRGEERQVGTLDSGTWSVLKVAQVPAPVNDRPEYWDLVVDVDGAEHPLRPMPTDIVDLNDAMRFPAAIVREGGRVARRKFYITRRGTLALKVTAWMRGSR